MGLGAFASSDLQEVLSSDPHAHFHLEQLCCDTRCLSEADQGDVFYPSWSDLWLQQQGGRPWRDHVFRVFCKLYPGYNLAVSHHNLVLVPANTADESQQWVKDASYSLRVKDNYGHPAFCLINKATGKILKHGKHKGDQVHLRDFDLNIKDDDIMWTESQDFGEGFKTIRCASNTLLNMTVSGRSKTLELDTWQKTANQLWKVFPL